MSDRAKVLSLFRKLYRAARSLPTSNRVGFVRAKVRAEYETHRGESDASRIAALRLYSETQLDIFERQRQPTRQPRTFLN